MPGIKKSALPVIRRKKTQEETNEPDVYHLAHLSAGYMDLYNQEITSSSVQRAQNWSGVHNIQAKCENALLRLGSHTFISKWKYLMSVLSDSFALLEKGGEIVFWKAIREQSFWIII